MEEKKKTEWEIKFQNQSRGNRFEDKVTGCPLMITLVLRVLRFFFLLGKQFAFFLLNHILSLTHHSLFYLFKMH